MGTENGRLRPSPLSQGVYSTSNSNHLHGKASRPSSWCVWATNQLSRKVPGVQQTGDVFWLLQVEDGRSSPEGLGPGPHSVMEGVGDGRLRRTQEEGEVPPEEERTSTPKRSSVPCLQSAQLGGQRSRLSPPARGGFHRACHTRVPDLCGVGEAKLLGGVLGGRSLDMLRAWE